MRVKKPASLIVTLMATGVFCASAQQPLRQSDVSAPAGERAPSSNRYLLIVDTSRSMRERTNAVGQLIQTVLLSGMDGQMRLGDTFGVWTYNEHLYSGQFPLQLWTPDHFRRITMQAVQFLEGQHYQNKSDLATVMPDLLQLVKRSDFITVILLTDGNNEIHGTPFDGKINEFFRSWKGRQERLKMPIVVFLRGQKGKLTDYRVSTPPWPLDSLPPPPPLKPVPVKKAEAVSAPVVKPKPRRMLPPLIVHGSQTVSADETTSQPPKETPAELSTATVVDGTLKVKAATPPVGQATGQKEATTPTVEPQPAAGNTAPPAEEQAE
ncbi:MAG TPA: hypothetical protein VKA67_13705, partial [Verrucomicrobiae bacterium]|nr:hypothetical protein [Verrucomicrobiae bacterium]